MINKTTIGTKSKFMENLTHDSYVIQACRITDVRYVTNLDKLLSIFEQKYFIVQGSEARKEYPYHPEDENMKLITDILYEMGANPEERKEIESEEEALRVINNGMDPLRQTIEEKDKTIEEKDKTIEEKDKTIGEQAKSLKEKDKTIEEQAKSFEEEIAELKRLLQKKQVE
jgi:hypothetical protein